VPPGVRVKVQLPVGGKPDNTTLPVERTQLGCVLVPTTGAVGVMGWVFIGTLTDADEVQFDEFVTVNVYDPPESPLTV